MKKLTKTILPLMLILIAVLSFAACGTDSGETTNGGEGSEGLKYTLINDGSAAKVSQITSDLEGEIRIASTYEGKPVVEIASYAFSGCWDMTGIVIPDSITAIGDKAFNNCKALSNIIIPNSVVTIGDNAFEGCIVLASITIPKNVTTVGENLFSQCEALGSIKVDSTNTKFMSVDNCLIEITTKTLIAGCKTSAIPADGSVTNIGNGAFSKCSFLESITIPNGVTSIGNEVFLDCYSLTSITIPSSVETIGNYTFQGCTNFSSFIWNYNPVLSESNSGIYGIATTMIIPDSITEIQDFEFIGANHMKSVIIPISVSSIGLRAFYDCYELTNIYYKGTEAQWTAINKDNESIHSRTTVHYDYVG